MSNQAVQLDVLRHSAAHILAQAIMELYPDTRLTIGPATTEGFFYDILPVKNIKEEDLPIIEERMRAIVARNLPITHEEIAKDDARKLYHNNPFKLELIENIPGETVGIARQGDFYDLCRGGHVEKTGDVQWFELQTISGSYWRADKKNQALQRITGTAFFSEKDLRDYKQRKEDALKYDHRKLGKELDLFSFQPEGPGFVFYHPHGQQILHILKRRLELLLDAYGYQTIATPQLMTIDLWKQSGHYTHYAEHMYRSVADETELAIRPMNCPGAILVYKHRPRSYRELPMRLAEFGHVHRYELSGVLHGLFRLRAFTQDDGHIICTKEQIEQEVLQTIQFIYQALKPFDFQKISVKLATKPDNAMGDDALWDAATTGLSSALDRAQVDYELCAGEGAFYGPKIEFHIEDSMGRSWQCSTIQLDFVLPENFDMHYISSEGTKARPVMIHRAAYGSLERFFGILIEHYKGNFPVWLAPVQVKVLTITDEQKSYAQTILKQLHTHSIRATMDESSDPLSGKIKTAQLERIPLMLVIGKKEVENNTVTIRHRTGKQEFGISIDELITRLSHDSLHLST